MKTLRNLLLLFLICIAFSCKKDSHSDSNDSYVKIKKNGTWITYTGLGELGPDLGDNTKTDLGVSGSSTDMKEAFNIAIQLNGSNFTTGNYSTDVFDPYYALVSLTLNPDPSTLKAYDVEDATGKAPSKYTISVTSITTTQIKGTFTGNYLYDNFSSGDADGGVVEVTEGQFQVKRIR
ncbi:MAG: hypothetical protein ABI863_15185 [Ginsengibacter sp.]